MRSHTGQVKVLDFGLAKALEPDLARDISNSPTLTLAHRHDGNGGDIWIFEPRGTTTRLTFDATQDNSSPIWSPDGQRIAFASLRNSKWGLYQKSSDGTGADELLVESSLGQNPTAWFADGKALVYWVYDPKTGTDQWMLPLTGARKPVPLLNTAFNETHSQISPDGKWIAYSSNQSGQNEVYVKPFPSGDGRWQVSTAGGTFPRWRADGKEIFYFSAANSGKLMAVLVSAFGSTLEAGAPRALFDTGYVEVGHGGLNYHVYAVSPDGQRFLILRAASNLQGELDNAPITVILNWQAGLAARERR